MHSSNKTLTLYRGLKTDQFIDRGDAITESFNKGWNTLLERRASGDLNYPEDLNDLVIEMNKIQPLTRQYFTDRRELAEEYIREQGGVLLKIEVSIEDILEYFIVEFQNYTKRKEQFDVVYIVKGSDLFKKKEEWKFEVVNV